MILLAKLRVPLLFFTGLFYIYWMPIFDAPDEPAHFARAFGIVEGQWILRNNPIFLIQFIQRHLQANDSPETRQMTDYLRQFLENDPNSRISNVAYNGALYSPVPYLPHAGVIRAVLWFQSGQDGLKTAVYGCRLLSLSMFCGMLAWSFAIFPPLSWLFFWLAATPMALSQACVVSLDPLVYGSTVLLLSLSFGECGRKIYASGVFLASFILLMTKPPYIPVLAVPAAMILLIPTSDRGWKTACLVASFTVSIAAMSIWQYLSQVYQIYETSLRFVQNFIFLEIDPSAQLRWVLANPFGFVKVVGRTCIVFGNDLFRQFVGVLGWLEIRLPEWVVWLWMAFIPAVLTMSGRPANLSPPRSRIAAAFCLVVSGGMVIGILLSAYLLWVPVGSSVVGGIQGRYFHAVAAVGLVSFPMILRSDGMVSHRVGKVLQATAGILFIVIHLGAWYTLVAARG